MKLKYLVETDWAVYWLRGNKQIIKQVLEFQPKGLGLSIISLAELYTGIYRSTNPKVTEIGLSNFLRIITLLDINEKICDIFGMENARLRTIGQVIDDFDLMIASTCLYYDLTLLTNNQRHFRRIQGLRLISKDEKNI